jgi:hypothetical protein
VDVRPLKNDSVDWKLYNIFQGKWYWKNPKIISALTRLALFGGGLNIAISGATGGLGKALTQALAEDPNVDRVLVFSMST